MKKLLNLKSKYLKELNDIVKEEKVIFSELLFEGIWEKIVKVFPWLVKLENIEFLFKEESFEKEVEEKIYNIQEIVKKYKLNNYDSLINNVSEVILKNIGKDKLLDIISEELQLSKDYIGKLFKNKIGITIMSYQLY